MYRPAGPREIWEEHVLANPGSFSTVVGQVSDDWFTTARIYNTPARLGHSADTTAYATPPAEGSWYERYCGALSPAKVTAGATGTTRGGNLT